MVSHKVRALIVALALVLSFGAASPASASPAGGVDCTPGGVAIEPWQDLISGGVTRGAGTFCGDNLWDGYSVYSWDKASDAAGVTIWVKYDGHSSFTEIPATHANGIGIVKWKLWGMNTYDEIRIVWGYWAASKTVKLA